MIRVLIVDDHPVMRRGLSDLFSAAPDIEVVGEARDADEALALDEVRSPDVVLIDLALGRGGGASAARRILEQNHDTTVLMLSMYSDPRALDAALDAGAVGLLRKDGDPDSLLRGVRDAVRTARTE